MLQACRLERSYAFGWASLQYRGLWSYGGCMPILAVAVAKGGAGKSTVAINIAAELHARGYRVLLADADEQATSLAWAEVASERGVSTPDVIAIGDNLRTHVPSLSAGYAWTVVDCPGRRGKRQAAAMLIADLVLLPCAPSPADAWALGDTLEVLDEARALREDLDAAIVLNRADRTRTTAIARKGFANVDVRLMGTSFGDRVAFREAMAAGAGVTTYAPMSTAAAEVRALTDEVLGLLSSKERNDAA